MKTIFRSLPLNQVPDTHFNTVLTYLLLIIETWSMDNQIDSTSVMHYVKYDDDYAWNTQPRTASKNIKYTEKVFNENYMYIPELELLDPKPRDGSIFYPANISGACGDTKKSTVYYSAFPGRINLIRWKVVNTIIDGN